MDTWLVVWIGGFLVAWLTALREALSLDAARARLGEKEWREVVRRSRFMAYFGVVCLYVVVVLIATLHP